MKTIAIENGLDLALSKPVDMGGNRIDQLGAAAGGVSLPWMKPSRRCTGWLASPIRGIARARPGPAQCV